MNNNYGCASFIAHLAIFLGFSMLFLHILLYVNCKEQVRWDNALPFFSTSYAIAILSLIYGIYNYNSKKKSIKINSKRRDILMLMKKMCQFNPSAHDEQYNLINNTFCLTDSDKWDLLIPSDSTCESAIKIIKDLPLNEKKDYLNLLFKLAITQDGIKNDEWDFLMRVMNGINLNKNWKQYYIKRYSPLRTEFENHEYDIPKSKPITEKDKYFEILEISPTSDITQIKKAYHVLALKYHPDMHQNAYTKEKCEEIMAKINDAYARVIANL